MWDVKPEQEFRSKSKQFGLSNLVMVTYKLQEKDSELLKAQKDAY